MKLILKANTTDLSTKDLKFPEPVLTMTANLKIAHVLKANELWESKLMEATDKHNGLKDLQILFLNSN